MLLLLLTLEPKLYGVELDGHGGGAEVERRVGLVIVALGRSRLRGAAHATESCGVERHVSDLRGQIEMICRSGGRSGVVWVVDAAEGD